MRTTRKPSPGSAFTPSAKTVGAAAVRHESENKGLSTETINNETARYLVDYFGGFAPALRYARKIAAMNGHHAAEYHAAANAIAAYIDRKAHG